MRSISQFVVVSSDIVKWLFPIERYLKKYGEKLRLNGYEVLQGKRFTLPYFYSRRNGRTF